jgi:hypothetical protein
MDATKGGATRCSPVKKPDSIWNPASAKSEIMLRIWLQFIDLAGKDFEIMRLHDSGTRKALLG